MLFPWHAAGQAKTCKDLDERIDRRRLSDNQGVWTFFGNEYGGVARVNNDRDAALYKTLVHLRATGLAECEVENGRAQLAAFDHGQRVPGIARGKNPRARGREAVAEVETNEGFSLDHENRVPMQIIVGQ